MVQNKDYILSLLDANDRQQVNGKSRLLKMLYLLGNELKSENKFIHYYNFQFDPFQPSSEEIHKDLNELIKNNLIKKNELIDELPFAFYLEKEYSITNKGQDELKKTTLSENKKISRLISEIKKCYNDMPLSMLVQEVNNKTPMYCHLRENYMKKF